MHENIVILFIVISPPRSVLSREVSFYLTGGGWGSFWNLRAMYFINSGFDLFNSFHPLSLNFCFIVFPWRCLCLCSILGKFSRPTVQLTSVLFCYVNLLLNLSIRLLVLKIVFFIYRSTIFISNLPGHLVPYL